MRDLTRRYSTAEVTIVWKPASCAHSGICFAGLPGVFDPRRRPWVEPGSATTEQIVAQVKQCPSGALSIEPGVKQAEPQPSSPEAETDTTMLPTRIEVKPGGPLVIQGPVLVVSAEGTECLSDKCALCRCGGSASKPFCDGSHLRNGFKG